MSLAAAIEIVWWIGLVLALGLTVVAVKLLSELLRTLGHLRDLADWIAVAAEGLASALTGPLRLAEAAEAAEGVQRSAMALQQSAEGVRTAVGGERQREEQRSAEPEVGGGEGAGEIGGAAGGPGSGGGRP